MSNSTPIDSGQEQFLTDINGRTIDVLGFRHGVHVDDVLNHALGVVGTGVDATFPGDGRFVQGVYDFYIYLSADLIDGDPVNVYVKPGTSAVTIPDTAGVPDDGELLLNTSKTGGHFALKLENDQTHIAIFNPGPAEITVYAKRRQ
jgi:hypothetical protein